MSELSSDYAELKADFEELQAENARLQQRAERAELLVRLMDKELIALEFTDAFVTLGEGPIYCTFTNGIPDLTPEQWGRLAELERGTR